MSLLYTHEIALQLFPCAGILCDVYLHGALPKEYILNPKPAYEQSL